MTKKLIMENLMCSSCASKIENELNNLPYIENASFNFTTQTMLMNTNISFNEEIALDEIRRIVDSIEDGVTVYFPDSKQETKSKRKSIINEFTLGIILFALGLYFVNKVDTFYTTTLFWVGYVLTSKSILVKTIKGLKRKDFFNENTLMFIATIAAMFLGEYLEALMVVLFYSFGEFLQHKAVTKSTDEIKGLIDLKIEYTNVLQDGKIVIKTPEEVEVGDLILVKNGEKIPVDGIVIDGETTLNTSALTGESKPLYVKQNDEIMSGNINTGDAIKIRASKTYENSTVYKIIDLIENSTNNKAAPETFISKFARYYTPTVTILAILMFIVPSLINPANMNEYIYRAATFLVISCPCALVLSIPLSYFSGIGASARQGILFKGSSFLHMLTEVDTIGIDKTGTLTKGNFNVSNFTNEETLKIAASLESYSNHPIAKSITSAYNGDYLTFDKTKEIPGKGIIGYISKDQYIIGKESLLEENNIEVPETKTASTSVVVGINNTYIGRIIIEDQVKEESKRMIHNLEGINVTMLTGDNFETAKQVANEVGNISFVSNLLPEEKINSFNNLPSNNPKMFIGDGINDAPLLKNADIGVAMGTGSEIALDVADVIIMNDDLTLINKAFQIAQKTKQIVIQNIILTLGLKLLIVILAGFGLSSMLAAIFADVGVSLIAVANTLRIIYSKKILGKENPQLMKSSRLFKLCSDITILSILDTLTDNTYTIEDLANILKESTTELLEKIEVLVEEKLITRHFLGGKEHYSVDDKHIKELLQIAKEHSYC